MILSGLCLVVLSLTTFTQALINTDWKTLNREVTLKYFSPDDYYYSQDPEEIWREMGVNITCTAAEDGSSFAVSVPSNFHPELPIKMLTHGFASTVQGPGSALQLKPGWRDIARVLVLSSLTGLISPPSPDLETGTTWSTTGLQGTASTLGSSWGNVSLSSVFSRTSRGRIYTSLDTVWALI